MDILKNIYTHGSVLLEVIEVNDEVGHKVGVADSARPPVGVPGAAHARHPVDHAGVDGGGGGHRLAAHA